MARIRTVKPTHWQDKELSKISLPAHLLWIASWNFSDDKGVFEADPLFLKSQIFPRRTDIRVEQISQWLDQLVKARFIIPFTFQEEGYYVSRTFETHQRIDKPQASKIPNDVLLRVFQEHSKNVPITFTSVEYSIGEESNSKGKVEVQEIFYRKFAHLKLSQKEFEELNVSYTKFEIDNILDSIENYKKNTNYKSLFLTAKKWLEKEKSSDKKEKENLANGRQHIFNNSGNPVSRVDSILKGGAAISEAIDNGLVDGID